jgi:hypothetical protein
MVASSGPVFSFSMPDVNDSISRLTAKPIDTVRLLLDLVTVFLCLISIS